MKGETERGWSVQADSVHHPRCSFWSLCALLRCSAAVIAEGRAIAPRSFPPRTNDLWLIETNEAPRCLAILNDCKGKRRKPTRGMTPVALWARERRDEEPPLLSSHFTMETVAQIFQSLTKTKIMWLSDIKGHSRSMFAVVLAYRLSNQTLDISPLVEKEYCSYEIFCYTFTCCCALSCARPSCRDMNMCVFK